MNEFNISVVLALAFTAFLIVNLVLAIKVVRQSEVAIIERLGVYVKPPKDKMGHGPGLILLIPFIDKLVNRTDVRQRRIFFDVPAFTSEGSEVTVSSAISWRIIDAGEAFYRDQNVEQQLETQGSDFLRSAIGQMKIRELNKSREALRTSVAEALQENSSMLGVSVESVMIQEIIIPESIKLAMERAVEAIEDKSVTETNADAQFYETTREADGIRVTSEARSYELETIAKVIKTHGKDTVDYDVAIRQVKAIGEIGASDSTKSIILPTNVTESLGTLETVLHYLRDNLTGNQQVSPITNINEETDEKPFQDELEAIKAASTSESEAKVNKE